MYAVGTLVRTLPAARQAFLQASGLRSVQQLMLSGTSDMRVKQKAMNLITDLIELAASGEQGWDYSEDHVNHFVSAVLQLLQQAEDLDTQEKALLALQSLLRQQGQAAHLALEELGAEAVLGEVLTGLELQGPDMAGHDQLRDSHHDSQEDMYHRYVIALCAELLHHLQIQHVDL